MQQKADTTFPYIQRFMCPQSFHFSFAFTQLLISIGRFIVCLFHSQFSEYYATAEYCYRNKSNGFILDSSNFDFQFKR